MSIPRDGAIDPVPLQEWFAGDEKPLFKVMEESDLIWKSSWREQIIFVRDNIHHCFVNRYKERKTNPVMVVGTHISKSTRLPVYHINNLNGLEVWLRGNYYNWQVSVRSEVSVPDVFFRMFDRSPSVRDLLPVYFEGFKEEWVFDGYVDNPKEFSLTLPYGNHWLFAFMFNLTESVRILELDTSFVPNKF